MCPPSRADWEVVVPDVLKKGVTWLVVGFLVFYLLTQPADFADVIKNIGSALGDAFDRVIKFFDSF